MYEELDWLVGVLDGAGDPEHSCIIRGSRMFESKYLCPFDLSSSVPQREME
jgi:oleate hydratase